MAESDYRGRHTTEERSLPLKLSIDPGFVHRRKIQTILGSEGMEIIDDWISRLPQIPDWQREVRIDHIYKDVLLEFCNSIGVNTLENVLAQGKGEMFCSTEELAPCPNLFDVERAVSVWVPRAPHDLQVEFHYSTRLVASDTLKSRLLNGTTVSIIAVLSSEGNDTLVFDPLVIGFPWLQTTDPKWEGRVSWWAHGFFEHFVEDFDEFSRVGEIPKPTDFQEMKDVPERGFKRALAHLLGDVPAKDWGGETSDHFTSHIHLLGGRVTAAFLLKGPAHFSAMGLNHLGKNNDQIVRLASEPAEVLIVQHCHEITPPVRSTLRAFAVQPGRPRRYCLIDGRDSLWLLRAYGLYEMATSK